MDKGKIAQEGGSSLPCTASIFPFPFPMFSAPPAFATVSSSPINVKAKLRLSCEDRSN